MSPVPEHPTVISAEGAFGRVESSGPEDHNGDLKVLVNFDNGERLWVPADKLILQEDGNFQLQMSLGELSLQHTRPTIVARPSEFDLMAETAGMDATQRMPRPSEAVLDAPPATPSQAAVYPAAEPAPNDPEDVLDEPYFPPAEAAPKPEDQVAEFEHVQVSRVVESYREDVGAALLREEVDIDRIPVNEYVDEAPPIRYEDDRTIIPVLEEVLLVEKRLLLKEEVVITKRRTQVTSEQRELRQKTQVVVEPTSDGAAPNGEAETERFRRHYEAQAHPGARGFAYYEPAYRFGERLRSAARYRGWTWDQLAPEARALWERDNPGTWDAIQPAVQFAWNLSTA
jgi:uncharacterized protein (TIGR02271 family)